MPGMQYGTLLRYPSPLGVVELSESVLETFSGHRQLKPRSREAGGQLFCRLDTGRILVEVASGPRRSDLRGRFFLWPNRADEQADINRLFSARFHYIGDWHTHPEDHPAPSPEDLSKIRDILKRSRHSLRAMLLVVVGRAEFPAGIWCGLVSFSRVRELDGDMALPPDNRADGRCLSTGTRDERSTVGSLLDHSC